MGLLSKDKQEIQNLDENIFKQWGGCSRFSSDSGSETAICKGGPMNMDCGNPVRNGQEGVQCNCCSAWFHSTCQGIEIPAIRALDRFKILSWLCAECKCTLKRRDDMRRMMEFNQRQKIWIWLSAITCNLFELLQRTGKNCC